MMIVWLLLFIFFIVLEIITINLVTIWFALGSLAAMITYYVSKNECISIIVFVIISILSLVLTKPFIKKLRSKTKISDLDLIVGKKGVVIESITSNPGKVKVNGRIWTAIAEEEIPLNEHVKILGIDGVKLKVKKLGEDN